MKKLLCLFGLFTLCLVFTSCDKDEIEEITSKAILGSWEVTHQASYTYDKDGPLKDFDYNANKYPVYTEEWNWSYYYFNSNGTFDNYVNDKIGGEISHFDFNYEVSNGTLTFIDVPLSTAEVNSKSMILFFLNYAANGANGYFIFLTKRESLPTEAEELR
jgi:hypothetical protein